MRRPLFFLTIVSAALLCLGQQECEDADADGDGWTVPDGDCDNEDPNVHPGADELCDGIDNDCDTVVDMGAMAAYFDGSGDYLQMSDTDLLDIDTNDITIEAWVFLAGQTAEGSSGRVYSKGSSGWSQGYMMRTTGSATILGELSSPSGTGIQCPGTIALNDEQWHHVAAVFDRDGYLTLYVDGEVDTSCDISAWNEKSVSNENVPTIGIYDGDLSAEPFEGMIDEVRVWGAARAQEDLQSDMCRMLSGGESGLVGYWPLEADYSDGSGNGADGTAYGEVYLTER